MDPVEIPAESITAEIMGKCTTPLSEDHDEKFGVPSLEELGEFTQSSLIQHQKTQAGFWLILMSPVQVLTLKVCPQLCGQEERRKLSHD